LGLYPCHDLETARTTNINSKLPALFFFRIHLHKNAQNNTRLITRPITHEHPSPFGDDSTPFENHRKIGTLLTSSTVLSNNCLDDQTSPLCRSILLLSLPRKCNRSIVKTIKVIIVQKVPNITRNRKNSGMVKQRPQLIR